MVDWIIALIQQYGYAGIFLLMVAENVFPPLPSELIMPFAGFLAARGEFSAAGVLLAGTLGSLAGMLPWYVAGRMLGAPAIKDLARRHGRWVALTPGEIDRGEQMFREHGAAALVFGRMVPAIRTVIALPAGLVRLPLWSFLAWSFLGAGIWTGLLTLAGYLLEEQYERISHWLDPVSLVVVGAMVLSYAWRVLRHPGASAGDGGGSARGDGGKG